MESAAGEEPTEAVWGRREMRGGYRVGRGGGNRANPPLQRPAHMQLDVKTVYPVLRVHCNS